MTEYVVVRSPGFQWALPASSVRKVVPESEWTGETPVDVLPQLRLQSVVDIPDPRVVVVTAGQGWIPLRAGSRIEVETILDEHIVPLPELVARPDLRDWVRGVVLANEIIRPLYVLAPLKGDVR